MISELLEVALRQRDEAVAEAARVREALQAFLAVSDDVSWADYGDHTGMSWVDADRLDEAEERLRSALDAALDGETNA